MPDDNRFAGIGEGLDEPEETSSSIETETETADSADSVVSKSADSDTTDAADVESGADDAEGGPAFSFDETTAKSIYVREETLALLEDTEFEVEMLLRKDHSIRDVTGREFHDAAVRVLEDHVDEVVETILAAREE